MKKTKVITFICIMLVTLLIPAQIYAFPHGYKRHTDEIYATVRYDIPVYYDTTDYDLIEVIPAFTQIRVINVEDAWREIEYSTKKKTKTGWITEDEFYSNCLYYDGREKQILADGEYLFSWKKDQPSQPAWMVKFPGQKSDDSITFPLTLTYLNDGSFQIMRADMGGYLCSDYTDPEQHRPRWGYIWEAGLFGIERDDKGYMIRDKATGYVLSRNDSGLLSFEEGNGLVFRVSRTNGKVLDPENLRVFAQYDADWAKDYYGKGENEDPSANNFCTSACGIFAPMNAIYTLTGKYIDPHLLADYAVEKEYRVQGSGTDSGFFLSAARKFGKSYGFKFDGEGGSIDTLRKKLLKGDVAVAHVPGHYVAIVDYDKRTKKYLLLDSHYLPKRATCPYGDWVSASDLDEDTNLTAINYYFYRVRKNND